MCFQALASVSRSRALSVSRPASTPGVRGDMDPARAGASRSRCCSGGRWRSSAARHRDGARARVLPRPRIIAAVCYGVFGYGYIIPATFLPALAKGYVDDPVMFGLIWPVFGAAAALSTFASAWLGRGLAPRQLWVRAKWVLVVGVLAPALWINVPTLLLSAVCVGGTFMIITMAGIKEGLRLGGARAPLLVGVMTAAFGLGQIVGPLIVNLLGRWATPSRSPVSSPRSA